MVFSYSSQVHAFPMGISPNMNVIVRLVFELAYNYEVTVQYISHNTTWTHLTQLCK